MIDGLCDQILGQCISHVHAHRIAVTIDEV